MFRCKQQCVNALETCRGMSLRYGVIVLGSLMRFFYQEFILSSGFFAVKRRAVFILGAKWKALVRGWRRDCVVGGMETGFQWRKAHNPSAKCEAFHIAPRLFFMFFVFDFIHDSTTMHNLSPGIFHWTQTDSKTCWLVDSLSCWLALQSFWVENLVICGKSSYFVESIVRLF